MNKHLKNIWGWVAVLTMIYSFASCTKEKDDSKIIYGDTKIYMPQAMFVSGGVNNDYPVPSGGDSTNYNFTVDTLKDSIDVILGVNRSGMQALEAYSVKVVTDADTIQQMITNGDLDEYTALLPAAAYALPGVVSVPVGASATTFHLSLSRVALRNYPGQKLALAVKLADPSKYTLNPDISTTIVIIDVDALPLD